MRTTRRASRLIRTLVQLGKTLSIETFAEGIERQRELSLLRDERCDSGQGFLFAKPLEVGGVEGFLAGLAAVDSALPAVDVDSPLPPA